MAKANFRIARQDMSFDLPRHSIANLKAGHAVAHRVDLTGRIAADNCRPFLHEHARILYLPVNGIDGCGVNFDDDLIWSRCRILGGIDLKLLWSANGQVKQRQQSSPGRLEAISLTRIRSPWAGIHAAWLSFLCSRPEASVLVFSIVMGVEEQMTSLK